MLMGRVLNTVCCCVLQVSLFAELFNEMLMRDFAFCIYKALVAAPDRREDDKKDHGKNKEVKDSEEKEHGKDSEVSS